MLTTDMLLAMLAWPTAASLAVLTLLRIPAVRNAGVAVMVAPVAVAVGFLVAYWGIVGRPVVPPPMDAKAALPLVVVGSLVIAFLTASWQSRASVRWVSRVVFAVTAMWLVLRASIAFQWTPGESILRVAVLAAGMVAMMVSGTALQRRLSPRSMSLAMAAIAGLGAPVMLFSDSLLMAQLHGGLGMATAAVCAVVAWRPRRVALAGVPPVVMSVAWSLWVIALLFSNMPMASFILLVAALPAAIAASQLVKTDHGRWRAVATVGVVLALVAGSVATGGIRYVQGMSGDHGTEGASDYGYGYHQ